MHHGPSHCVTMHTKSIVEVGKDLVLKAAVDITVI